MVSTCFNPHTKAARSDKTPETSIIIYAVLKIQFLFCPAATSPLRDQNARSFGGKLGWKTRTGSLGSFYSTCWIKVIDGRIARGSRKRLSDSKKPFSSVALFNLKNFADLSFRPTPNLPLAHMLKLSSQRVWNLQNECDKHCLTPFPELKNIKSN